MCMSVVASVVFGFILLARGDARDPGTEGELENDRLHRPDELGRESMSQNWGSSCSSSAVVAQFFCLTASVTSASRMMFAFSRDRAVPGPPALAARRAEPRPALRRSIAIGVFAAALMLPAIWNFFVGYYVGTGIAVIGLYIAFILPVILRFGRVRAGTSRGRGRSASHYKWIDPICDRLGVLHQHPVL